MSYETDKNTILEMLRAGEKVNELVAYMRNILYLTAIINDLRSEGYAITSKPFQGKWKPDTQPVWFHNYKLKSGKQELLF